MKENLAGVALIGAGRMARVHNPTATNLKRYSSHSGGAPDALRNFYMDRYGESYRIEVGTFLRCAAQGDPPPVNAIDGLQTAYLAEAAGASLRLARAVELKSNCEVTWND
jgi:predicted dehydrogenase